MKSRLIGAVCACAFVLIPSAVAFTANASAIIPGNLLISSRNTVYEYTTSGTPVQSFATQYPGGYPVTEYARDIAMRKHDNVHVYDGTFSPFMSTYNTVTGDWSHITTPGFSTINGETFED